MQKQDLQTRKKIVNDCLNNIEDPEMRSVCFMLYKNYDEHEISKQLHISKKKVHKLIVRFSVDLLLAGLKPRW